MIITLAATVSIAVALGGGLWWLYRRGQDSGRAQAEREATAKRLAELQKELDEARARRRRL
jgi:hypothetical protein